MTQAIERPAEGVTSKAAPDAERRAVLQGALAAELQRGARIESQTDYAAVLLLGKPVNHVLHLVLSVLTVGLWLIVWAGLVLTNKPQRIVLTVDEKGDVARVAGPQ